MKKSLLSQIATQIETELGSLRAAAAAAHDAATHAENKPENKYDTRGLEASYLAGAQEARVLQLQSALELLRSTVPRIFRSEDAVDLTAVVELSSDDTSCWYFLIQVAGGYLLQIASEGIQAQVVTVTPQTPLGRALKGKRTGDEIVVRTDKGEKVYELVRIL